MAFARGPWGRGADVVAARQSYVRKRRRRLSKSRTSDKSGEGQEKAEIRRTSERDVMREWEWRTEQVWRRAEFSYTGLCAAPVAIKIICGHEMKEEVGQKQQCNILPS